MMFWGYTLAQILIAVIVIAGLIAIAFVVLRKLKVEIPDWGIQIFWVIVIVVVGVFAIKLLVSLL